jgi:hypothetical protein
MKEIGDFGLVAMTEEQQSETDRTLCLVSGYHPHCFPPVRAYVHELRHRFAVVLNTFRRDKVDMYFDADLFLNLVPSLCHAIGYDSINIEMTGGYCFHSFDDLARYYSGLDELHQYPPTLTNSINIHPHGSTWLRMTGSSLS